MLSVVIGTRNRLGYLKKAIASIREGEPNCEIVVVDGLSDDGTQEYLRTQDVAVVEQEPQGAVRAFNLGASLATQEFVCLLNDDILVHGNPFSEAMAMFGDESIGQVAIPFTDKNFVVPDVCYMRPGKLTNYLVYGNFPVTRKEIGDQVGWWGEGLYHTYAGDSELSMRIWQMGLQVVKLSGNGYIEHLEAPEGRRENTDSPKFYEKWKDLI
jgi:glycosyltransferase involved in cell wall biosynthesis